MDNLVLKMFLSICSFGLFVENTKSLADPDAVRLVGGASRCDGHLQLKRLDQWRDVVMSEWNLKTGASFCRRLDCGSVLSVEWRRVSDRSVWRVSSSCVQSTSSLRDCVGSQDLPSPLLYALTCSDSVRLLQGPRLCSGALEVHWNQSWTSVCDDNFDLQDAEVVCRELGCGAPSLLQGVLYGEGRDPLGQTFQCEGHESALMDCTRSNPGNTCSSGKAVDLTCSEQVRLVGQSTRCAGTVEVRLRGEWRPVYDWSWSWDLEATTAVCRDLDCGSAVSGERKDFPMRPVWRISGLCVKQTSSLRECVEGTDSSLTSGLEVVCSGFKDIDGCEKATLYQKEICGKGTCKNIEGSYLCQCFEGYTNHGNERTQCSDIDECEKAKLHPDEICGIGTCENVDGSYLCQCPKGYTNYANKRTPCSELNCSSIVPEPSPSLSLRGMAAIFSMMRNSCLALSNTSLAEEGKTNGEALLETLFTATESILSPGQQLNSTEDVSGLLQTVEDSIRFIGPQLNHSTRRETTETEAEIAVQRGRTRPTGPVSLTNENARLDTDWETASGEGFYPGFAIAALLSYKNLDKYVNHSFEELKGHEKHGVDPAFQMNSKLVSVVVSNPSTQNLSRPVSITLRHTQMNEECETVKYVCVYWSERGAWATHGCRPQHSNATHTVCQCDHLSSFAVLMALYPMEHTFGLQLVTKIGLTISLLCLILCIFTFTFCHSIKGTRTTIHLHLCICLFVADLVFLAGISHTQPVAGCRFVAALLHYVFLGVFTWMLLEGVQLYHMLVLVFNATMRPLYMYIAGYGVPLVIVIISAIIRPTGYGTDQYCWLSLKEGLIWSFFGPVCIIIIVNILFFIITVWKLVQKFTSLNPDLSHLHKIRAFTVTALAQMCILGLMWVFGAFMFQEAASSAVAYIFTILNSLQGALILIMHCLLSKQVREEYAHIFSCICPPQKRSYSGVSSNTNPSSSQSQGFQSGQHTGESKPDLETYP